MSTKKIKSPYYTEKEHRDFIKLCQIHGFKNRKIINEEGTDNVVGFNIYLPIVTGAQEKLLSNITRYTNSRKTIQTAFTKKWGMMVEISLVRK